MRCRCGFVYSDAALPEESLREESAWENSYAAEAARRKTARPFIKPATAHIRQLCRRVFGRREAHTILEEYAPPGAVIDLGAGAGEQLNKISESFTPDGAEISAHLAREAKTLFAARGGDAVCASALAGLKTFSDNFFVAASLRSYLEHESRPREVLQELRRVLKPDAVALVKVPNYASWNRKIFGRNWCGFRLPDHLNYFTPATLQTMAAQCGYVVHRVWAPPLGDNLWMLLRRD